MIPVTPDGGKARFRRQSRQGVGAARRRRM